MKGIFLTMSPNASAKKQLRSELRLSLALITPSFLQAASAKILNSIDLEHGTNCALFAGTSCEPQLLSLLSNSKIHWHLPRVTGPGKMTFHRVTDRRSLSTGCLGIQEPQTHAPEISPEDLDTILCPGIAFTPSGMRLGQGGGYYDRYLPRAIKARQIGITFDQQIRTRIPADPHDIAMHEIITESRHFKISNPEQRG